MRAKGIAILCLASATVGYAMHSQPDQPVRTQIITVPRVVTHVETKTVQAPAPPAKKVPESCNTAYRFALKLAAPDGNISQASGDIRAAAQEISTAAYLRDFKKINELTTQINRSRSILGDSTTEAESNRIMLKSMMDLCSYQLSH